MAVVHHGTIGIYFGFYIKYFIPIVLLLVLIQTMKDDTLNPYGGYPWKYLSVGIIIFSLMVIIVAIVALFPQIMAQKCDEDQAKIKVNDKNGAAFSPLKQVEDDNANNGNHNELEMGSPPQTE